MDSLVYITFNWLFLALKMKPDYLKALLRRAQSYEATEKLEEALEGDPQHLNLIILAMVNSVIVQITRK